MFRESIITRKTNENNDLEVSTEKELEVMDEFDQTKVEPKNFTRKTLLECSDCLSYL